jgi:hypothetical protein
LFISEELESYINNFTFYGGGGYNNRYINIPKNLYISMNDYFKISLPEVYAILHLYLEKKFNLEGSWFSLRYQD